MAFYEDLEANLYSATQSALTLAGHTGVEIVYANSNALEPANTYCVINIINLTQTGYTNEDTFLIGTPPALHTVTHYIANVQYSIIGERSRIVAPDFRHAVVNNRASLMAFKEKGFGLLRKSQFRNIPQLRDTTWVDCFNFDVELSFAITDDQQINWVDYVKINNTWIPSNPPSTP